MLVLVIFFSCVFLLAAFLKTPPLVTANPFFSFLFFLLHFFVDYFFIFLAVCIIIFLLFFWQEKKHMQDESQQVLFRPLLQLFGLILTTSAISFVILFLLAAVQVNYTAFLLRMKPSFLGIEKNTSKIATGIGQNSKPPFVIDGTSSKKEAVAVAQISSGNNEYASFMQAVPDFFIVPINEKSPFLFINNTLIITHINPSDLQKIAGVMAYAFVREYFPNQQIKLPERIFVLPREQFTRTETGNTKTKLEKVKIDIAQMEQGAASLSATLDADKKSLQGNTDLQNSTLSQRNSQYNACLSQGTYDSSGKFIPKNTKVYCQIILDTWNTTLTQQASQAAALQEKQNQDSSLLKQYQYYDSFFKTQQQLLQLSESSVADELGVFDEPNTIRLSTTSENNAVINFFERLTHEYLHYTSYTEGKRFDSNFFEEGLTEYFARKVIEENLNVKTYLAYPAQVYIIHEMTRRIAEPDFESVYFTKDEVKLEKMLNLAYGDGFYQNNYVYFESLMYATDPIQIVDLTNTILAHMQASHVTQQELFGDYNID